jgi:DNA-binding HxlR family transcriptional regulator
MRFSDLRDALGGISPKVLTQSLRALERDGLVARRAYKQVPPKAEYSLTELGGSLCAPVKELRAAGPRTTSTRSAAPASATTLATATSL